MTSLATFGICILITLALILIPFFIVGEGFALLIIIFPAIITERITGERGLDLSHKSYAYLILLWIFIGAEVLIIASVFFGLYCFFWGYPTFASTTGTIPEAFNAEKITFLAGINKLLLFVLSYFLCNFIYHSFKYHDSFKTMSKKIIYLYRILPLIMFPLAFTFLIASLIYLADSSKESIRLLPRIAGHMYAAYLLYGLTRTIFIYARNMGSGLSGFELNKILNLFITITYDITFLYFFFQFYPAIKI